MSLLGRLAALAPRTHDLRAMLQTPRHDLVAGVTVGVVALPLALAFGITSGLGATAGLVTAVVAGTVAAVFGGSRVQVSGPTGAMTVVLVPIVAEYGARGVLLVGLMAGALLVLAALLGLGGFVRYVPLPVLEGFTLGIAVIIALQQVPAMLGVPAQGHQVLSVAVGAVGDWAHEPRWAAVTLAAAVAGAILVAARSRPGLPAALGAVAVATVVSRAFDLPVGLIGDLPSSFPAPSMPSATLEEVRALAAPALAVAALAALESLLSATVADAMTVSERHDPDRELFGQGLANLAAPIFGGVPATAAIARTAVNVRSGARSRLAAVTHAMLLLLVVMTLAPVVSQIPLAALAGVLVATAVRMVEVSSLRALARSSRGDLAVLVVTFVATVLLDLATAVVLGIVVAGALALRQLAGTTSVAAMPIPPPSRAAADGAANDPEDLDDTVLRAQEQSLIEEHVVAYRLDGPLFFGAAHAALLTLTEVDQVRVVVLRMSHVTALDATAASVLVDIVRTLQRRGVVVLVSGLPARFHPVLAAHGLHDELSEGRHLFATTPEAIHHARDLLALPVPG